MMDSRFPFDRSWQNDLLIVFSSIGSSVLPVRHAGSSRYSEHSHARDGEIREWLLESSGSQEAYSGWRKEHHG